MDGASVFKPDGSGGRDCRVGHCINSAYFVPSNRKLAMNLCNKGKVAASFALGTLAFVTLAFYQTTVRSYFHLKPSHGWALIFQFFARE